MESVQTETEGNVTRADTMYHTTQDRMLCVCRERNHAISYPLGTLNMYMLHHDGKCP